MSRKVILFELNEVPFAVIDRFIRDEPASAVARVYQRSRQYLTMAADTRQLDPWVTWPTLHRGVPDERHGILHLGQQLARVDAEYPPIWQILRGAGRSVGVFGSLHSSNVPKDMAEYAFYAPDVFADRVQTHPAHLSGFQAFNLAMTRASARNVTRGLPWSETVGFLASIPRLGIRPTTAVAVATQVASEVVHPERKVRRRALQTRLMYDIFARLLERTRPDFATFYSNHVAAAMHRYWAAAFPDDYEGGELDPAWLERYGEELHAAMAEFSNILSHLARFVLEHDEYVLMITGSMGQAAIPNERTYEFLTVTDADRFASQLGAPAGSWRQRFAMVPCLSLEVDEAYRAAACARLETLVVGGKRMVRDHRPIAPLSYDESDGALHVFVQFDNYAGPGIAEIGGQVAALADLGLGMMAHEDGVNCTAQHVPEGALVVFDPRGRAPWDGARPAISTLDIVPSLLANFGVKRPAYLEGVANVAL